MCFIVCFCKFYTKTLLVLYNKVLVVTPVFGLQGNIVKSIGQISY